MITDIVMKKQSANIEASKSRIIRYGLFTQKVNGALLKALYIAIMTFVTRYLSILTILFTVMTLVLVILALSLKLGFLIMNTILKNSYMRMA